MTRTVFAENRSVDFTMFDKQFQQWLRLLVLYVEEHGGVPVTTTTRYRGKNIGEWFARVCAQPHTLTESERTVLRAVPGVYLTPAAKPRRDVIVDPDRAYLWRRLKLWAQCPTADPVTRRRWEFYYRSKKKAEQDALAEATAETTVTEEGRTGTGEDTETGGIEAVGASEGTTDVSHVPASRERGRADSERRRAEREAARGVAPVLQKGV